MRELLQTAAIKYQDETSSVPRTGCGDSHSGDPQSKYF